MHMCFIYSDYSFLMWLLSMVLCLKVFLSLENKITVHPILASSLLYGFIFSIFTSVGTGARLSGTM